MFKTSSLSSEQSQNITIPCMYHPKNSIQNFCLNNQCLLPMCSSCIGLHVSEHQIKHTFPSLCSIDEAIRSVRQDLSDFCFKLEEISHGYASSYRDKQKMEEECRKTLTNLKYKVLKEIEIQFASIESKISQQLFQFDEKMHSKYHQISEQSEKLYQNYQSQLSYLSSNQKILRTLIKYHSDNEKIKNEQILVNLQNEIEDLKKEGIRISIKPMLLEMISQIGTNVTCYQYQQVVKEGEELPKTIPSSSSNGINFFYGSKSL